MTESISEPRHVGPIAGGNLRASDADRERVAAVLSTAYAEGRLTRDEHDERLDQLLQAKTFDELVSITGDLVVLASSIPAEGTPAGVTPAGDSRFTIDTTSAAPESDKMVAVFGGVNRTGRWRIRRHTQALALFGGMDLDLRNAVFEAPVVEIAGFWCFGGMDIKVPEGIEVRDQTAGVFGGTDIRDVGEPVPGAPVLVIKGMTLFGGISVHGPRSDKKRR